MEFERNLKHFKFWEYIYWRHGKATLTLPYYLDIVTFSGQY